MIVDRAADLAAAVREPFDIAIFGAGAAGITLATELLGAGRRIALFEGGGLEADPASQGLYRGRSIGQP